MRLKDCKIGRQYRIESLKLEPATTLRLKALGLTDGTMIEVLNNKRSGSVIFRVRGTRLAVGRGIAEAIYVENEERVMI